LWPLQDGGKEEASDGSFFENPDTQQEESDKPCSEEEENKETHPRCSQEAVSQQSQEDGRWKTLAHKQGICIAECRAQGRSGLLWHCSNGKVTEVALTCAVCDGNASYNIAFHLFCIDNSIFKKATS